MFHGYRLPQEIQVNNAEWKDEKCLDIILDRHQLMLIPIYDLIDEEIRGYLISSNIRFLKNKAKILL